MFAAKRPLAFALLSFASMVAICTVAHADPTSATPPPPPLEGAAPSPCDPDISERIDFISGRLDERRRHARRWWMGFTSFYGIGTIVTTSRIGQSAHTIAREVFALSSLNTSGMRA